jgi:hypothetical protein
MKRIILTAALVLSFAAMPARADEHMLTANNLEEALILLKYARSVDQSVIKALPDFDILSSPHTWDPQTWDKAGTLASGISEIPETWGTSPSEIAAMGSIWPLAMAGISVAEFTDLVRSAQPGDRICVTFRLFETEIAELCIVSSR